MSNKNPRRGHNAAGAEAVDQSEQLQRTAPPISFQSRDTLLDSALAYASGGCYVLPLHWIENGYCSCGKRDCSSPGKHPLARLVPNGSKDASNDPTVIEERWRKAPKANIGIATGPSGLVVLDLDGAKGQAQFRTVQGPTPRTLVARTGRDDGYHIYFRGAVPSSQVKGEHLDVRGTTGYVVAPPSNHISGRLYQWANKEPIAPVPAWVAEWVACRKGAKGAGNAPVAVGDALPMPTYLIGKGRERLADRAAVSSEPWSAREEARLRSALAAIPADLDGATWFSYLAAIHDLGWFNEAGENIGLNIADDWSKTSKGKGAGNGEYRGRQDLEKRWAGFDKTYTGPRVTVKSIYFKAKSNGWRDETHHSAQNTPIDFYTDLGNARGFVKRHGQNIRFIYEWQKWIVWNGNRWEIDNDGAVVRLAKETVSAMYLEALQITDQNRRAELIRHALKSQAQARLDATISLAESELEVVKSAKALDADPWLIGARNVVIDLKKNQFRAGRREDFITKQTGVSYVPNAPCPEWLKFLDTVTGNNKELQGYLQRAIGYTLTGSVREEVAFVLYGTGNNGKSTFRETVHMLFGDYALAADAGLLTERKTPGGATEEIARLRGCRFVAVNETNENDQLHEARVKFITSQDTITARSLYGHFFDFFPTHKTFITTNHKPIVRGTDEGIWRRLHLIPFTVTIPKSAVEKDFRERWLVPEMAGILNWAIEGAAAYLKEGLNPPAIVRAATDDYRQDMDVVGQWLEERCVRDPAASTPTSVAYDDYYSWATGEIGWTLTRLRWRRNLSDRGFEAAKGSHGRRMIQALRLKAAVAQ